MAMPKSIRRVVLTLAIILFGTASAAAQNAPSVILQSFLNYDVWDDGRIRIDQTDLAFAPSTLRASVLIRTDAGNRVAEHKFYEDYRVTQAVFGRMVPPGGTIQKFAPGNYAFDYKVGGEVVTSIPFSVVAGSSSSDPFAPKTTVKFVGPWQKWAYLAPYTRSANSAAGIFFWVGSSDLPDGMHRAGFVAKAYRNGKLIAHSNPQTGNIGNRWIDTNKAFFQVPHAKGKSHQARNVTLADFAKPGSYRITIEVNETGKVIRTYNFNSAGGQITPNPRTVLGYQPAADYIAPRAQLPGSSQYGFAEVHWISG